MESTLAAIRAAAGDAILLTGDGDAFSAGLNLKEVAGLDRPGLERFLGVLEDLVAALYTYPGPTIAWVNGHAIAGGCVLAMCCDLRVMTSREGPRIGLNEVAIGVKYPPKVFQMVRARLRPPAIDRVVLDAALYDARTALWLGLVDVVGDEIEALKRGAQLAALPRDAYAAAKHEIRGTLADDPVRFRDEVVPYWASDEVKARLSAVLKR
jgi:enoyl-CoA hydratase/carnithine racemase